jgi:hypothetical protein
MTGRRWWAVGLAVWALSLLVAAVWSAQNDPATVREQSDLATGRHTLDRAVSTMVTVAGPAVAADVRPYELADGCQLTLSRSGTELDQTVVFTVPAGQEEAVLDRLVTGLPEAWGARYNPNINRFFADAGDFVAIRGEVGEPGEVRLTAATGCRPGTDPGLPGSAGPAQ